MKTRFSCLCSFTGAVALASCALVNAQDIPVVSNPKPMFAVLPPTFVATPTEPAAPLPTWNGSFVYGGHTYNYNMVGANPNTGTSTTVQAFLIPLKIVVLQNGKPVTFDPGHVLSDGNTVTKSTRLSPIFDKTTDYNLGGTDIGATQYLDAFQRANFWGTVKNHTGYHVLLGGPTVGPKETLNVPASFGSVGIAFGVTVAMVDINWLDGQLHSLIAKHNINPNQIPIFLTYDTYLTSGGCCIGGYHSSEVNSKGVQAYMHATYIDKTGAFSQNVSALSHEVGEYIDDPLTVNPGGNPVQCGILEVGDPEEGFANFGAFPYTVNGFTYDLQDLVFLEYFGAPNTTSVSGWETFHNNPFHLGVCNNGG